MTSLWKNTDATLMKLSKVLDPSVMSVTAVLFLLFLSSWI